RLHRQAQLGRDLQPDALAAAGAHPMSLTLALTSAISGLSTAQAGLDVISNNIANVNTEGYTRKIFVPESVVLAGNGAGVQVGDITNNVDQNLMKDLRGQHSATGLLSTQNSYYSRVQ